MAPPAVRDGARRGRGARCDVGTASVTTSRRPRADGWNDNRQDLVDVLDPVMLEPLTRGGRDAVHRRGRGDTRGGGIRTGLVHQANEKPVKLASHVDRERGDL